MNYVCEVSTSTSVEVLSHTKLKQTKLNIGYIVKESEWLQMYLFFKYRSFSMYYFVNNVDMILSRLGCARCLEILYAYTELCMCTIV